MGLFKRLFGRKSETITRYRIVQERGNGAYIYNGKVYQSDIVQACLQPYVKAIGKLCPKHIRRSADSVQVNPEPYMRFLLEEPNTLLTMQKMLEKLVPALILSGNAFILIVRDSNGYPMELFPVPAADAQAIYKDSELYIRFVYQNGSVYTHKYDDLIHLRMNLQNNDVFGESIMNALTPLTETVEALPNGNLLKGYTSLNGSTVSNDKEKMYVLSVNSNGKLGFYHSNNANMSANKAYLEMIDIVEQTYPQAKNASFVFGDIDDEEEGTVTGITVATENNSTDAPIYDLSGRKVENPGRGIYIRNNKKFVVK